MCPPSVQVCLGLAIVTWHHYGIITIFDYTIQNCVVPEKANLRLCAFADNIGT